MDFGSRLREERARLGLTQSKVADFARIDEAKQFDYEISVDTPDSGYLNLVARLGVDVLYVITGNRLNPHVRSLRLGVRQSQLLAHYDFADPEGKNCIARVARLAARRSGCAASEPDELNPSGASLKP